MAERLGILAGGGAMPARVAQACVANGRAVFMLGFEGQTNDATFAAARAVGAPCARIRLGAGGEGVDILRAHDVTDLVMVGPVKRPSLGALRPDWRTAKFFAKVGRRALGDDGFLSALAAELELEGFRVVGVDALLADLTAAPGPLGAHEPDEQARIDIQRGVDVARAVGGQDVGQAVIVQQGLVLGVEAIEGTDALIERCGGLRRDGPGGVLVKVVKPGQDRRLDRPTIGPHTAHAAQRAGLRGIAVEAGGVLVMDRAQLIAAADAHGLFVVGVDVSAER